MASYVSDGVTSIEPITVLGYSHTRTSRNILHDVIQRVDKDVAYGPTSLRSGTLSMLVATLAEALALDTMHGQLQSFTLEDSDLPALDMTYVVDGALTVELDPDTRDRWLFTVDFQEVLP